MIHVSLCFEFSITNNKAEYEFFIVNLTLAAKMGAENIKLQTYSQVVVSQVKRDDKTKNLCNSDI